MSKTKGFLLAAAVAAMAFILSCGLTGEVSGEGNAVVVIGEQTWFKRNLDVVPTGTNVATNFECYGEDGYVYDAESRDYVAAVLTAEQIQANCDKYGRFYDWVTAMKLPSDCHIDSYYNRFCEELIQPKHQGICPDGWHIPSEADWDNLLRYIDDDNGSTGVIGWLTAGTYGSYIAGKHLKSKKGWEEFNMENGLDTYGFSVLPVKYCFWSTQGKYIRCFNDNDGGRIRESASGVKVDGKYSVRCVKD